MKLGKLLLLAGAAYAANRFLKSEKGKQLKKEVSHKAEQLKGQWSEAMHKQKNGHTGLASDHPSGNLPNSRNPM